MSRYSFIPFFLLISLAIADPDNSRPPARPLGHSLQLKQTNTPVREVLARVLETSGLEWFIDQEIEGTVSLHLSRASWEQALEMILATQGLYQRRVGSMITIFPKQMDNSVKPKAPEVTIAKVSEALPLEGIRLLGIVGSSDDKVAIVSFEGRDRMIRRGDALPNGQRVIRIEEAGVQVEDKDGKSRVYVF